MNDIRGPNGGLDVETNSLNWVGDILWARELDKVQFQPVEWLIEGILPHGLAIIAGKSKIGKSWLVLHVALCVAGGAPIFGKIQTRQGAVLYLALEDNPRRLQDRIRKLQSQDEIPEALAMFTQWVNVDDGCFGRIETYLDMNPDCRLVIVDTFAKVRGRPDGRSSVYIQDYKDMTEFKALADRRKIAVLLVHHTRKQDAEDVLDLVSGSTGIVGAADTIMVLTRPRGSPEGKFIVTGRDIKDDVEQAARFDNETGKWELLGPAAEVAKDTVQAKVRQFLASRKEPMSTTDIADALGLPRPSVRSACIRGRTDGIQKMARGLWGIAGKAYVEG